MTRFAIGWRRVATVSALLLSASALADPGGFGGKGVTAMATLFVVEFLAMVGEAVVYGFAFRMNGFLALAMSFLANLASFLGTPVAALFTLGGFNFVTYLVLITLGILIETAVVVAFTKVAKIPEKAPPGSWGSTLGRIVLTCAVLNFVSIFCALTATFLSVENYGRV